MSNVKELDKVEFVNRYYPDYEPIDSDYERLISSNIHSGMTLLDGGCGRGHAIMQKYL